MKVENKENKRVIFVTDIHSQYTKFMNILKENNYNPQEDILILGGDYFDRGYESVEMAEWLIENHDKENIYLIRGNHDDFLEELFIGDDMFYQFNYTNNGFSRTVDSLSNQIISFDPREASRKIQERYPELKDIIENLYNYIEIDDIVYTHGGLPFNYEYNVDTESWKNARWANSVDFAVKNDLDKEIVIGHFSVQHIKRLGEESKRNDTPFKIRNVTFADSGLSYSDVKGFAYIKD